MILCAQGKEKEAPHDQAGSGHGSSDRSGAQHPLEVEYTFDKDAPEPYKDTPADKLNLEQLKQAHPHLRTLVSHGGGGAHSASFPDLAANPTSRATLTRSVRAFVDAHALNGVDLDWEHPSSAREGADYAADDSTGDGTV